MGVRRLGGGDRDERRVAVCGPFAERDGLEHNLRFNLTVSSSASSSYALKVMTISAVIFLPLVLLYKGWSFTCSAAG
jgi:hypothetical protein